MGLLNAYRSTIGKKAIMAVTGLILVAFVIGHMAGNLQVFIGPARMNYSRVIPLVDFTAETIGEAIGKT